MSDTTTRIGALLRNRPALGADDETWAVWFDEKAAIFDAIADADPTQADARGMAAKARGDARRRRRANP